MQEMTLAEEANPPVYVCCTLARWPAERRAGEMSGCLVQVVFLEDRADISFAKVVLN